MLLLDVNVLLALAWPTHQFHRAATSRLGSLPAPRWATCALTQIGFVRLSCNPAVVGVRQRPVDALAVLAALTADRRHQFLQALPRVGVAERLFARVLGHQQVTDAYLLALAKSRRAVLLTFDGRLAAIDPDGGDVEILS